MDIRTIEAMKRPNWSLIERIELPTESLTRSAWFGGKIGPVRVEKGAWYLLHDLAHVGDIILEEQAIDRPVQILLKELCGSKAHGQLSGSPFAFFLSPKLMTRYIEENYGVDPSQVLQQNKSIYGMDHLYFANHPIIELPNFSNPKYGIEQALFLNQKTRWRLRVDGNKQVVVEPIPLVLDSQLLSYQISAYQLALL